MALLILRDADGKELGRREMTSPQERYDLYMSYANRDCIEHDGKRYRLVSVAWRVPEEQCICCVTFEGYVSSWCDC